MYYSEQFLDKMSRDKTLFLTKAFQSLFKQYMCVLCPVSFYLFHCRNTYMYMYIYIYIQKGGAEGNRDWLGGV